MIDRTYDSYSREELIRLLRDRDRDEAGGLRLHYTGQTPPYRIVRRVQPRAAAYPDRLGCGPELDRSNIVWKARTSRAWCRSTNTGARLT